MVVWTPEAPEAVAEALTLCGSLLSLRMGNNRLGPSGGVSMVKVLSARASLTEVRARCDCKAAH